VLVNNDVSEPLWFVVRVKPRQETRAADNLRARVLEVYCPWTLEPASHKLGPKGPVPLFPGYLFAFCSVRQHYKAVSYCPGVAGFVRFGKFFATVEEDFLDFLQRQEDQRGLIPLPQIRKALHPGTRVRIARGAFRGYEGFVDRYLPAKQRVRLLLELVTGTRALEVDAHVVVAFGKA
jgi:transcriptional antiterminator RfaH